MREVKTLSFLIFGPSFLRELSCIVICELSSLARPTIDGLRGGGVSLKSYCVDSRFTAIN